MVSRGTARFTCRAVHAYAGPGRLDEVDNLVHDVALNDDLAVARRGLGGRAAARKLVGKQLGRLLQVHICL